MTIYQPRLDHVATWETTPGELRAWRDKVAQIAATALHDDDAPFGPSEEACRWCPVAAECRPRMEAALAEDFSSDPNLLTPEELAEVLPRRGFIAQWLQAVEETALRWMYSEEKPIPGYKVVRSGGRRTIKDTEAALSVLHAMGYTTEQVTTLKLLGIGDLERLLGEDHFDRMLGVLAPKSDGRPAIAPESDPRPGITSLAEAQSDFKEEL